MGRAKESLEAWDFPCSEAPRLDDEEWDEQSERWSEGDGLWRPRICLLGAGINFPQLFIIRSIAHHRSPTAMEFPDESQAEKQPAMIASAASLGTMKAAIPDGARLLGGKEQLEDSCLHLSLMLHNGLLTL